MTRASVVLWFALAAAAAGYVHAGLGQARAKADRSRCSGNVRQLGLAAIQFADDRRGYPDVVDPGAPDGGVESSRATRTVRLLYTEGYHDNPEGFVCPSSSDASTPVEAGSWTWRELRGTPDVHPLSPDARDPKLSGTTELSYGWTRRALSMTARGDTPLAADRAVRDEAFRDPLARSADPLQGNHVGGLVVLRADATVEWVGADAPGAARLTDTLGILDPLAPRRARAGVWEQLAPEALALLPLGLVGLLVWLRAEPPPAPRAPRAPRTPRRAPRARAASGRVVARRSSTELQAAQRCPYCHDEVAHDHALTRCPECRAVFHDECVPEGGVCTTLGCPGRRPAPAA